MASHCSVYLPTFKFSFASYWLKLPSCPFLSLELSFFFSRRNTNRRDCKQWHQAVISHQPFCWIVRVQLMYILFVEVVSAHRSQLPNFVGLYIYGRYKAASVAGTGLCIGSLLPLFFFVSRDASHGCCPLLHTILASREHLGTKGSWRMSD